MDKEITIEGIPCKYERKDKDTGRVILVCENLAQYSVDAKLYKKQKQFRLKDVMIVSSAPKERKMRKKTIPQYKQASLPPEYLPTEEPKRKEIFY